MKRAKKAMNSVNINSKIDYFHSIAEGWDERVGNNSERADKLKTIFEMIDIKTGDSVLDAGCGNGVLLRFIEEKIGANGRITALDAAPGMIDEARKLHSKFNNISYVTDFIERVPFPEKSFDVVFCYAVIPHIDYIPDALSNISRMLKNEGKLYIFHPASAEDLNNFHSNLNAPVKHDNLPDEAEMKKLLSDAGFKINKYIDEPGLNFMESFK